MCSAFETTSSPPSSWFTDANDAIFSLSWSTRSLTRCAVARTPPAFMPRSSARSAVVSKLFKYRTAAGKNIVSAMCCAVSPSMLIAMKYCSTKISKRLSSSRLESTPYFSKSLRFFSSTIFGRASMVLRRLSNPRPSASVTHSSE